VVLDGDEETACITPCAIPARPGRHTLLFTQEGHYPERREVQLGRETEDVNVSMRAFSGTVMIASEPSGATVTIEGRPVGQTPVSVPLPVGKHSLVVSKEGFTKVERTIDIEDGAVLSIRVSLGQ
jgi:hypothetical protein